MCETCGSNRQLGRRGFLRLGAAGAAGAAVAAVGAGGAAQAAGPRTWKRQVTLRWFGAAGWELGIGDRRVLVDPWLTRFPATGPNGEFDGSTPLRVDQALIDRHITAAELVLVTHGHFDHLADVPHVLRRHTTARAIGTETHAHLLTAYGIDPSRLLHARGGEYLEFDGYRVRAMASLHSQFAGYGYVFPGTLTSPPRRPPRIVSDLPEGGTLAYQVEIADGPRVFFLCTANLIERELTGLDPDIAVIAVPSSTNRSVAVLERALRALGNPRYVIPNHHDDMATPLGDTVVNPEVVRAFRVTVARVSPASTVIEPSHLRPIVL